MSTAAFYTLGCKVNQAETRRLAEALHKRGWQIANSRESADVYIINSCTVTAESARKTRQAVRRFKKNNPQAKVALIGCMPSVADNLGEQLPEADIILRQDEKDALPDVLHQLVGERRAVPSQRHAPIKAIRQAVKIQDGCDRFCSYCVIPLARGRARSVPLDEVLNECRLLLDSGTREIILTGINLGSWGAEQFTIADAVQAVSELPELLRLRLGSLEPDLLTHELLEKLAQVEKLCPHFHISLQSGSDSVLQRMNRQYSSAQFAELCTNIRKLFLDCTITTDIITGFPGETYEEFAETLAFAQEIMFEKTHVFPYSARPGTRAAEMPNQLSRAVKEQRARELIKTMDEIRQSFLRSQVGKTLEIMPEEIDTNGFVRGYTANYIPVRSAAPALPNGLVNVLITGVESDYLIGVISAP